MNEELEARRAGSRAGNARYLACLEKERAEAREEHLRLVEVAHRAETLEEVREVLVYLMTRKT